MTRYGSRLPITWIIPNVVPTTIAFETTACAGKFTQKIASFHGVSFKALEEWFPGISIAECSSSIRWYAS